MKKIMALALFSLLIAMLSGCGETTSNNYTTTVTQGDNGVYIDNEDGNVTYVADSYTDGNDEITGEYDEGDDEVECKSKGYFWCPITRTCNNTSGSGGTCSGRK